MRILFLKGGVVMTLASYMFGQFSFVQYAEFFLRIIVACLCGACIGYERTKRLKEAGIRTHVIVCCAAALTMIVSKYSFADLTSIDGIVFNGTRGADPARVAAQIISGVSFLGAGMIFRNGNSVRGLTTAAGIWATAGIGLAIGAGMYVIGVFATLIVAVIQIVMHWFVLGADTTIIGKITCVVRDQEAFNKVIDDYLARKKMQIITTKVTFLDDGAAQYELTLRVNMDTTIADLTGFVNSLENVRAVSCELGK